jgi:putative peptidoglycan lipid II flippase
MMQYNCRMGRLIRSTGTVALSTLASRILGLARDMLMAAFFSATGTTDAFYVAFRIPNMARRFVAEGVLTISFIPVYTEYLVEKGREEAFNLAGKTVTLLLILLSVLVALGIIFSPQVVRIIAIGFSDPSQIDAAAAMTRIMFPFLFLVGVTAFCMGVLNSHRYFFAPAFAPFVLNVGIIAGILFLGGMFEEPLYGVSIGVLAGGLLQVALQIPYLARTGFRMRLSLDLKHPGVRKIFRLAAPGIFSMGVQQINMLVVTLLGSFLASGSISYIYFSDRLHELVLGIFVVSIANVMLPEMSALAAEGNSKKLMEVYRTAVKSVLLVAIPAAAALMAVGYPVISVLFMHNKFTALDAELTYRALLYASIGIPAMAVIRLTNPLFYALHDSRRPFYAAAVSLIVTACCGYAFMQTGLRHAGLTLAVSVASIAQMTVLVGLLARRAGDLALGEIIQAAFKHIASASIMVLVIRMLAGQVDWRMDPLSTRILFLAGIILSGGGVYLAGCHFLRVREIRLFMDGIRRGR